MKALSGTQDVMDIVEDGYEEAPSKEDKHLCLMLREPPWWLKDIIYCGLDKHGSYKKNPSNFKVGSRPYPSDLEQPN